MDLWTVCTPVLTPMECFVSPGLVNRLADDIVTLALQILTNSNWLMNFEYVWIACVACTEKFSVVIGPLAPLTPLL